MKEKIRVSMGTLRVLGLELLATYSDPTTAYLQTYHPGRCRANCVFCAQAKDASSNHEKIARGLYPPRDLGEVTSRLSKAHSHDLLRRACIQTMNYAGMLGDLEEIIRVIRSKSDIPISVSIYPFPKKDVSRLKELGADKIVIPLDAVRSDIFDSIKGGGAGGPYRWEKHLQALYDALDVFGTGNVGTHIIIGLGESEEDVLKLIASLHERGVYSALFAYTPVPDSRMECRPPKVSSYRRIQLASYLVEHDLARFDMLSFESGKITSFGIPEKDLMAVVMSGEPFLTRGCPDCNRPFSTEKPGGILYNYPEKPSPKELETILGQLSLK